MTITAGPLPSRTRVPEGPLSARMFDLLASTMQEFETPPHWSFEGLCAQTDPEVFFPEKGGSTHEAKRICADCKVRAQCLEYALDHGERFGIWGGLSARERYTVARRRSGSAGAAAAA